MTPCVSVMSATASLNFEVCCVKGMHKIAIVRLKTKSCLLFFLHAIIIIMVKLLYSLEGIQSQVEDEHYSTLCGLIRLVISLECFIEITPDFLCPVMIDCPCSISITPPPMLMFVFYL